ncbi:spermatogenesis-associated protein 20 [Sarocladium implicatum]|nr:spermatogenesis-associated protein 20 [Sarocladium implicatum]
MAASAITAGAMSLGPVPIEGADAGGSARHPIEPLQNRARDSKSPFIASAADSAVKWQLLDNATVERARRENKLLFLHIGYQACHHCYLMASDSFSNQSCAPIINESFIPVLIDREQRPDIDNLYMNYVQGVSGAGGWPLNIFVTAEMEPVFGGTYFPGPGSTQPSSGDNDEAVTDFQTVLKKVRDAWLDQEARCRKEASESLAQLRDFAAEGTLGTRSITGAQSLAPSSSISPAVPPPNTGSSEKSAISSELDLDQLEEAYRNIAGTFDPLFGGFGLAPKFPTPPKLAFLLSLKQSPSDVQDVVGEAECQHAQHIATDTLRKIRDGAMRDHVGGNGFARFSVTSDWSIPNFERLLADNALLLELYLEAWKTAGGKAEGEFYDVVIELANYLTSPPVTLGDGAFASSEAADSLAKKGDRNSREGAYYTWTNREFESVFPSSDKHSTAAVAAYFGILEDGNVDQDYDPNDDFINQNILKVTRSVEDISKQFNVPADTLKESIAEARKQMKEKTVKDRPRPQLDDKVVTGWNGLAISALARTAAALKDVNAELSAKLGDAAVKAATFVKTNLWEAESKTLFRIWRGGKETEGFADDYAYFIQGLLDLYQLNQDQSTLALASELQKAQTALFYDSPRGGFFSTTASHPFSPIRLKDGMDTSLPSINAVSVSNLFRLSALQPGGDEEKLAHETINAFEPEMLQYPWLYPGLLGGVVRARLGA